MDQSFKEKLEVGRTQWIKLFQSAALVHQFISNMRCHINTKVIKIKINPCRYLTCKRMFYNFFPPLIRMENFEGTTFEVNYNYPRSTGHGRCCCRCSFNVNSLTSKSINRQIKLETRAVLCSQQRRLTGRTVRVALGIKIL